MVLQLATKWRQRKEYERLLGSRNGLQSWQPQTQLRKQQQGPQIYQGAKDDTNTDRMTTHITLTTPGQPKWCCLGMCECQHQTAAKWEAVTRRKAEVRSGGVGVGAQDVGSLK